MQTPAVCGKIPPFPAPRRKRARNRAPLPSVPREPPPRLQGRSRTPARAPSWRSLGQSPTARPRYPAQTKVKTRSAPFAPHREVRRARRPSELQSYRPALSGRSNVAEGANRARRSFHSLANIGVLRAGRAQPLYLLTPSGRFGPLAQVPTGHTLPFGAPSGRFGPSAQQPTGLTLPSGARRAGSLRQRRKHSLRRPPPGEPAAK